MKILDTILKKARSSRFYLWLLNRALWWAIPFNSPHRFRITEITQEEVTLLMPYIRKNFNHIGGLHACGLATLCEYACGLQLMNVMGTTSYRIIMKTLHMSYHFQARSAVKVTFSLSKEWVEKEVLMPLESQEAIFKEFELNVFDDEDHKICTAKVNWQIKSWDKVKTNR